MRNLEKIVLEVREELVYDVNDASFLPHSISFNVCLNFDFCSSRKRFLFSCMSPFLLSLILSPTPRMTSKIRCILVLNMSFMVPISSPIPNQPNYTSDEGC